MPLILLLLLRGPLSLLWGLFLLVVGGPGPGGWGGGCGGARSTGSAGVSPWAVVLAGGEGPRLRPLIRRVLGDERPKQSVPLLGPRSLLRQPLDRVALRMPVSRTVVVTVRAHTGHIAQEFTGGAEPPYVLVHPIDRGTAAGILHPAHCIRRRDPEPTIAFFPSSPFTLV